MTRAAVVTAMALAGLTVLPSAMPVASAAAGDGTVQVRVVQDAGAHGYLVLSTSGADAGQQTALGRQVNPPLSGVAVTLADADGDLMTAQTDADGIATFNPSSDTDMTGGQYRVDVTNPKPGTFFPGFAANNQVPSRGQPFTVGSGTGPGTTVSPVTQQDLANSNNEKLSSNTEFVDVSDGSNAYVNTSFWYPSYYSQDNAPVVDAAQPWDAPPGAVSGPTETTLFSTTYHLDDTAPLAMVGSVAATGEAGATSGTGAVYGIAYDRAHRRIFSAAYAKRGSAYGPGGPGGIYVTDLQGSTANGNDPAAYPLSGTTSQWTSVPDAGTATHDMGTHADYGFFDEVGNQSLGDIDITSDGKYLFGVNMANKTVFVYDISAGGAAGTPRIVQIPVPDGCTAEDWHPMGTGTGLAEDFSDVAYVGGVCSPTVTPTTTTAAQMDALSAHVYDFDPATGTFGTQILDQSLAYDRGLTATGQPCEGGLYSERADRIGRWFPWTSSYPIAGQANLLNASGCGTGDQVGYPTPMLADIVQETNGDLIISMRNRFSDQGGWHTLEPNADGSFSNQGGVIGAGDLVRGCMLADGGYVLDPNFDPASDTLAPGAVCTNNNATHESYMGNQPATFREYYTGDATYSAHPEASYGGIALSRSEPTVISSATDPNRGVNTQGVHAIGRDGARTHVYGGNQTLPVGVVQNSASGHFVKGMGMADLEVLTDPAPIQIGNRVWSDDNANGIQDSGEAPIAGVTVHLYDADGNPVLGPDGEPATAVTNDAGYYYFDGTNVDGGLSQDTDYVVKLDDADDYDTGGPLAGRTPTVANADDNGDDQHDSDGVVPDGGQYPQIALTTAGAGQDNHTYDFGFVQHAPAVDIEKYDTLGGATDGDADTAGDAIAYTPGESRTIAFDVTNTGTDALRDVVVTDDTITGGTVTDMSCTFPGHTNPTAGSLANGTWTVTWAQTQGASPTETWAAGVKFPCTATLTMNGDAEPHADNATVTGTDVATGETVDDSDAYNAYTGDVQLVKYDGRGDFTPTQDANGIPQKPLVDGAARDANDVDHAVTYVVPPGQTSTGPQPVSWAVTNTGTTWLGDISITDDTLDAPGLTGISCDFSPVGGPTSGTTWDGPWAPGTTFYCTGELTLASQGNGSTHGDRATVDSTVIAPEPNPDYNPGEDGSNPFTDQPATDGNGNPVLSDVHPSDDDTYYANTTVPSADLVKGDGDAATEMITHDANTMDNGQAYNPGETRDIVLNLHNTGQVPLYDVTVTDALTAGNTTIQGLSCVFPGQTTATAGTLDGTTWTVYWTDTFEGTNPVAWAPDATFSCTATLTLDGPADPHADTATVTTNLSPAGVPGDADNPPPANPNGPTHSDAYNAYTGDIQVIKYDGNKTDPAVGSAPSSWTPPAKPLTDADQDANDTAHAVDYPVGQAQPVRWVVSNTGGTWLTNITLGDTTNTGPDIGAWTCDLSPVGGPASYSFTADGPWAGPLAPGASFFCQGPLTLPANSQHADTVDVTGTVVQPEFDDNDQPVLDGNGVPEYATDNDGNPVASDITVDDNDAFNAQSPGVSLVKGDGDSATDTITHDANTMDDGQAYAPGETRDIVINLHNTGFSPLYDVTVTDALTAGNTTIKGLSCVFPGQITPTAGALDGTTWTVYWTDTFEGANPVAWAPGATFSCTATLTLDGPADPHADTATVTTNLSPDGVPGDADNPPPATPNGPTHSDAYNAYTGDIQVIKYDGNKTDPAVGSGPNSWTPPAKPLVDADQDANDAAHAVDYPNDTAQPVRWVVTNIGGTWLTSITLGDTTNTGPDIGAWSCDLSPVGGPASYSFTKSGPWAGPLAPGASFFCQGPLTLPANSTHADTVDVTGTVVQPEFDDSDQPILDQDGVPEYATDNGGNPVASDQNVADNDDFNADTATVNIVKGDGHGSTIVNDADTTATGAVYDPSGETRTIVTVATNPSPVALHNVVLTDVTTAGSAPTDLSCTFPDGTSAKGKYDKASQTWTTTWAATFAPGTTTWAPKDQIVCHAKLALDGQSDPHRDLATVNAVTPAGDDVTDSNPYNAFSGDIQVVKYDGNKDDPQVGKTGAWTPPAKPLSSSDQDANDTKHAVGYDLDDAGNSTGPQTVRWVVTNTGKTWLTDVVIADVTDLGPSLDVSTVSCTFPDGTKAGVVDKAITWRNPKGVLFAPGASFFCQGMLTLGPDTDHADHVNATATIVPPAADADGNPTDKPLLGPDGLPERAVNPDTGKPWTVSDSDAFHAKSAPAPGAAPASLSSTGTDSLGLLEAALALLIAGLMLLLMTRRIRRN